MTVADLKPSSLQIHLIVKVSRHIISGQISFQDGRKCQLNEFLVGDETGSIHLFVKSTEMAELCIPGTIIQIRNGHIEMSQSRMYLIVGELASIEKSQSPKPFEVNILNDLSVIEWKPARKEPKKKK